MAPFFLGGKDIAAMTKESNSSVIQQNRLLSQLLSLNPTPARPSSSASRSSDLDNNALIQVSDQVPAGRGLIFTRKVEPGQVLLTLAPHTLINVKSYESLFHPASLPAPARIVGSNTNSDFRLSSAQLLSLLLSRAKVESRLNHARGSTSADNRHEALRLFVQTLPTNFDTVPLIWSLHASNLEQTDVFPFDEEPVSDELINAGTWTQTFCRHLLQALPLQSKKLVRAVRTRFEKDWSRICHLRETNCDVLAEPALLSSDPELARSIVRSISLDTFLWAWLCVNSRCVFLPLGLSDHADNFTLAPMLDMANHTQDPALECKVRYAKDGGLELCAPSQEQRNGADIGSRGLMPGDECFITYGPHSDDSLLSEYGFVLPAELTYLLDAKTGGETGVMEKRWRGNRYAEVCLDREVEAFLNDPPDNPEGRYKRELLQNRGYWGDYTVHPYPEPAHPSHRLIPALRLASYDLVIMFTKTGRLRTPEQIRAAVRKAPRKSIWFRDIFSADYIGADGPLKLDRWEETLTGYSDKVSDENELEAHDLLAWLSQERCDWAQGTDRRWNKAKQVLESNSGEDDSDAQAQTATISEPSRDGCQWSLSYVAQLLNEEREVLRLVMDAAGRRSEW